MWNAFGITQASQEQFTKKIEDRHYILTYLNYLPDVQERFEAVEIHLAGLESKHN